ncbi:choice-of-anchor M domain-containing protein [Lentzea flaviverrucosa]|uniref:Surface-anchored protein n=1 Tax=Lentzea flaviverrucosa TaxID=200379 RepID=A0A1H9F6C4_9PSEU|nr:choice-of-anchor M domain-containing protein [Lentzea flaviverrucosa]RDI35294.1 surface-anchored protein [Lentzea flaviverrucosa]SEQ33482.1 surface-anchored protein [Lentzea flaviverrucosa]
MNRLRSSAMAGVVFSLLLVSAPAATAEPEPATVELAVRDHALQVTPPEQPLTVLAGAPVHVRLNTKEIAPGTLFGDVVRLRTTVVGAESATVPVSDSMTTEWVFATGGVHTVRLDAEAYLLDGTPVQAQWHQMVEVQARQEQPAQLSEVAAPLAVAEAPAPPAVRQAPAVAAVTQPPVASGKVTVERGHVDALAPRLIDGGLRVHVKDGSNVGTVTWREPADVEFKITDAARVALPDASALSFLGAAGGQIHLLPQQEQPGILWIGWSTEELKPADITGPVTWTLTSVTGPGPFGLFTTGSFGAHSVIFNSTDGVPDTHSVALGTHAHANWAFGKPGRYQLKFTVSATKAGGGTISDTESYTFLVGNATATTTPDNTKPDNTTRDGRRNTTLASTGPTGSPVAATALALALIATGAGVMVLTRRRTAKETP